MTPFFVFNLKEIIMNTTTTNTSVQAQSQYFDLHANGTGYLSRVRTVSVKKGADFVSVSIASFHGDRNEMNYTHFDAKVSGENAKDIIELLRAAANDKSRKVIVGFTIGDFQPESYVVDKGVSAGQTRFVLKGRLLKISFAKIDGKLIDLPKADLPEPEAQAA
jgi:Protein of unknown function (DUF3577)